MGFRGILQQQLNSEKILQQVSLSISVPNSAVWPNNSWPLTLLYNPTVLSSNSVVRPAESTLCWLLYGLGISALLGCCTACSELASFLAESMAWYPVCSSRYGLSAAKNSASTS
jgi:hypothetical protein